MASLKFPENLFLKRKLIRGDMTVLAIKTGYTRNTIYEIMNGRRRLPDKLRKAMANLLIKRNNLNTTINELP